MSPVNRVETLYDVLLKSIKGEYFMDSEGTTCRVEGINLHDKHSEVSMIEVLTGQSVGVGMLCIKEYEKLSKKDVEATLSRVGKRISKERENL